jgi:fatty-acyl-CoA synthase
MIISGPPAKRYPWEPITIAAQLERTAALHGDREAVITPERRLTWAEVRAQARVYAKALIARGISTPDNVAVWLPNQVEWVLMWFATAYLGAVQVPINSRYKREEAGYILSQSQSKLLLARESFLGMNYRGMIDELVPTGGSRPGSVELPDLKTIVFVDGPPPQAISVDAFLAAGAEIEDSELERRANQVSYDDPTIIVYTSGTTGHPKGAVHSHQILRNECSITEWMGIGPDSRILGHMPWFHVAGGFTGILPALIAGAALVVMDHWDPRTALELIARERVTSFSGIPTHFIDLVNHPSLEDHDISSLDCGWMGGASNPPELIDRVFERLRMERLLPVYGMTETTSVTTFPRPEDPQQVVRTGKGVPVSDFELKVVDLTGGAELDAGQEGEICVRGHCVMRGYYRNPDATAAVLDADGWFHTGDLGNIDERGYLEVTGRKSDMFIVGGANVYPAEVEAALAEHPGIVQAYVVGAPDARLGEIGVAFIQRRDDGLGEDDVRTFAKERLADYKVPRRIEFVLELPLTPTGKIQRFRLREMAGELVHAHPLTGPGR